jgi:high-affinity nickel permease
MTTLPISSAPILILGFWLGVQHAAEPDHVAAVTAMATQAPSLRSASRLGLVWGLGHSSTMMLVGLAMIVCGRELPADLTRAFEGAAGVSLLLLAWLGGRASGATAPTSSTDPATTSWHSFVIGMVHGLAGSAAIALLLLTSIHSSRTAVAYLLVFAAGTTLAMGALSGLLARSLASASEAWTRHDCLRWVRVARMASATASAGIGVVLLARSIGLS